MTEQLTHDQITEPAPQAPENVLERLLDSEHVLPRVLAVAGVLGYTYLVAEPLDKLKAHLQHGRGQEG